MSDLVPILPPNLSLIWDVNYVPDNLLGKRILNFLSGGHYFKGLAGHVQVPMVSNKGVIKQGELVALMGPSGAGKSSLLKCLALGRNHPGFQGTITFKGLPGHESVRGGIINQDDKEHLIMTLTVRESLEYASNLKNQNADGELHQQYVMECLAYLELTVFQDKLVQDCSGGTTKRLAVGMELITRDKPHFLLLDEPTSGLDSEVGETLVQLLADCAKSYQMSIIATIHQPKPSIFQAFNRVFILAGDGSPIYTMEPSRLRSCLKECGWQPTPRAPQESSIEIAIKIAARRNIIDEQICMKMIDLANTSNLEQNFCGSNQNIRDMRNLEEGLCYKEAPFTFRKFMALLSRTFLVARRQQRFILIRFLLHAVMAGVMMTLFVREIGEDDGCLAPEIQDDHHPMAEANVNFQFFSLLFLMFASLMPTVLSFPSEMKLFMNEYRNGMYSTWTYYLAKTLVEIPLQLLFPYMYCSFIYWYFKQPGEILGENFLLELASRFGHFLVSTLACCLIAQGLGFLIGIMCVNSFNNSIIVASSTILFLSLYSGFFVKVLEMGVIARVANVSSFIRYGFESILISLFGKERCTNRKFSGIMESFNLNDSDDKLNYIMMGINLVGVRLAAFLLLKCKVSKPRFGSFGWEGIRLVRREVGNNERGNGKASGWPSKLVEVVMWAGLEIVLLQLIVATVVWIVLEAMK